MSLLPPADLTQISALFGCPFAGQNKSFSKVSIDSRSIAPGELFVALAGPRFDGHEFIDIAKKQGAVAAVVHREVDADLPVFMVPDTRVALAQLAHARRQAFMGLTIAITGSNGKTTVKEMIAAILRNQGEVLATQGNLNNDIGLPLTLMQLSEAHQYAVLEMGANHAKEIESLAKIAQPEIAIVTNVGCAHIEGFGSKDGIAKAKGELYEQLAPQGIAVINADEPYADFWAGLATHCKQMTFAIANKTADVRVVNLSVEPQGSRFELHTPLGVTVINLPLLGRHNILNAAAAATVAIAAEAPLDAIAKGLAGLSAVSGRLHAMTGKRGALIIDDTYNANPDSLQAGIDVLADFAGQRILVLADMLELGSASGRYHQSIGEYAKQAGLDGLYCFGEQSEQAAIAFGKAAKHFTSQQVLLHELVKVLGSELTILVKGSRGMKMENIVKALV